MREIHQTHHIAAPPGAVWQALTDADIIDGWGGGPVEMAATVNFEFKLWGGDIWGRNLAVVKDRLLRQEWFGGDWDEPSVVTFELFDEDGETRLELDQANVPDDEVSAIDAGWREYYLGPLREMVENS